MRGPAPLQVTRYPLLDTLLLGLQEQAAEHVAVWALRHAELVRHAKAAWDGSGRARDMVDGQRVLVEVADALRRDHETFAAFLEPPTGAISRWQRVVLLFTALNLMCAPRRAACMRSATGCLTCRACACAHAGSR